MKNFKKQLSFLMIVALVISTIALGFGQIKSQALQAAGQTIQYRIYAETSAENCMGVGTDNDYKLFIVFDDYQGWYSEVIDDTGDSDDMQSNDNNNFYVWGPAKPITSTGLYQVNNTSGGNWGWDVIKIFAEFTPGTWTEISTIGSGSFDTVGGTINVPYNGVMDTTYNRALTFNGNGGTVNGEAAYTLYAIQGATLPLSNIPAVTKDGYNFAGWSPAVPATGPNADTTYTAQWTTSNIKITFDANGGTGGTSIFMNAGEPLTAPTVTRTGYTLTGWSPEVPTVVPDVSTTYTAQWTAKTFTVTFSPQGGTVSPTSSTVSYGSTYGAGTGGFPTPERTGYTFGGWYTSTSGTGINIISTTMVTITAPQTLYAYWTSTNTTVTITFDANGGTGGTSTSMTVGAALTAPAVTRTGYTFAGWSPTVPATVPATDTTYTAQWTLTPDFTYTVSNSQATITQYNGAGGNVVIPSELGGYPVVSIISHKVGVNNRGAFYECTIPTVVTIPDTMTVIGDSAFAGCSKITGVNIPGSVTTIGKYAFFNCLGLTTFNIGSNVSSIGIKALNWCDNLTQITVDSGNNYFVAQDGVLFNKTKSTLIQYPGGLTGDYVIPDGVTTIGDYAFSNSYRLNGLVIPESVTYIGDTAFGDCTGLTSILLPSGLTTINSYAFVDCIKLKSAYFFGNAPPSVGSSVFASCASGFTVYYLSDKTGFTSPTWNGYPTAVFSPVNTSTITFDANGGTGGTGPTAMTPGAALTAPTVTRTGYTFTGWSPVVPSTVPAVDTTYTAQWAIIQVYLTWNPNGGTWWDGSTEPKTTIWPDSPGSLTRNGYTFSGWSPIPPTTQPAANTPYIAQWSVNDVYITFEANGGTGGTSTLMQYGETLTAPIVTRTGYTFAGWSPAVPATVPEQDTVYTAQWDIDLTEYIQFIVSNSTGDSGDTITVSITISENSTIGAAKFELPFDPELLEYVSASAGAALTSGMADINFDAVNNKIIMTYINSNGLTAAGSVLDVQFRIKENAPPQTIHTNFAVVELTDSNFVALQSIITQGTIVVTSMLGDVNGDGAITPIDALMALKAASGKIILTGTQILAADVNKDGNVSVVDALRILQYASGKITTF